MVPACNERLEGRGIWIRVLVHHRVLDVPAEHHVHNSIPLQKNHFRRNPRLEQPPHQLRARAWWGEQPRCTTKSAWITISAARSLQQRVECPVARAKLGIAITLAGK